MVEEKVDALCAEFGIRIIPCHQRRRPGDTHARATLGEILGAHGPDHLALTLRCIRQSDRNREEMASYTIGGVSDVLAQRPDWCARSNTLLSAMVDVDLVRIGEKARELRPWPLRETFRALLYLRLETALDGSQSRAEAA